jgi:hypothetical protein
MALPQPTGPLCRIALESFLIAEWEMMGPFHFALWSALCKVRFYEIFLDVAKARRHQRWLSLFSFGIQRRKKMHFFYETGVINLAAGQGKAIGPWDLSGYSKVAVGMWAQGPAGAQVNVIFYFGGWEVAREILSLTGAGANAVALVNKVYPSFAPTLSVVLAYPSAQMIFMMRLYAACCGASSATPIAVQRKSVLKKPIRMDTLIPAPYPQSEA